MFDSLSKIARGRRAALFLAAPILLAAETGASIAQGPVEAWLETTPAADQIAITAFARGGPLASARYELTSEKAAGSSRSTTRQAGSLKLACCEPVTLSHLSLGIQPGERYTITLKLFDGEALLVEKILLYPQ